MGQVQRDKRIMREWAGKARLKLTPLPIDEGKPFVIEVKGWRYTADEVKDQQG